MKHHRLPPEQQSGTVTLTLDEWQEVVRLLERMSKIAGKATQRLHSVDREMLTLRARQAFTDRRKRIASFGASMFGEPAWDMLLILYTERDLQRQTIGHLVHLIGAAPTTVHRWLKALEDRGLVRREQHPTDSRVVRVELTDKAERALDSYFSETLEEVS